MKRPLLLAIALLGAGAILAGAILASVQLRYGAQVVDGVASAPEAPVAIVFGAGIRADGRLSPMLQDRVDTAIALYKAGKVRKLLMSGDNRFADYNEPGRMYDYAVARGVPAEDIVRDYAGRRTYDTCYRAVEIFGVDSAVLITQRFHLPRALFTCESMGMRATGLSADLRRYGTNFFYRLRDSAATLVAWWDVTIARPTPVLGERIDIGI